jgi:alpha-tubulin suppressor-like RCC1 family protein
MTLRVLAGTADTLTLTATAIPDTSRRLTIVAGDNQVDTIGQTVPTLLRIRVTDVAGNAIAGAVVIMNDSLTNGVSVGTTQVTTDGNGEASTSARLGIAAGPAVVRARLRDRTEVVTFTLTAQLPLTNVFAGNFFTCGLAAEGRSYCWGFNDAGQLAKGTGVVETVDRPSSPVTLGDSLGGPFPTFRQLAVGRNHACGVTLARQLLCWGTGNAALGATTPTLITEVNSVASTAAVATGEIHTCVLDIGGKIRCAGENQRGELGRPTSGDPVLDTLRTGTNPTVLDSISDPLVGFVGGLRYSAVTAGQLHTCAFPRFDPTRTTGVTNTMRPLCWGDNTAGQLGNGTTSQRVRPDTVAIFPGVTAYDSTSLVAGAQHTCVLSAAGDAYCWGSNAFGQLGNSGTTGTGARQLKMVRVSGGRKFVRLAAGDYHTCGIDRETGNAYCWGRNNVGQLGNGGTGISAAPVLVTRPSDAPAGQRFIQLSLGELHSCGVLGTAFGTGTLAPTGTAYCWGDNEYGQLGDGARSGNLSPARTPKRVIYQP